MLIWYKLTELVILSNLGNTTTARWGDVIEALEQCYQLGWTDGLPVVPPLDYRVAQFVEHAGREASEVVGEIPERCRQVTVGESRG